MLQTVAVLFFFSKVLVYLSGAVCPCALLFSLSVFPEKEESTGQTQTERKKKSYACNAFLRKAAD